MYRFRRLTDGDIPFINDLQRRRGYAQISGEKLPEDWVAWGAFTEENEIAGICFLFCYSRIPHADYPSGRIAELGGCYTDPKHRERGIMTRLIGDCLRYAEEECPELNVIVADASNAVIRILTEKFGFTDAVEGERRLWKASLRTG